MDAPAYESVGELMAAAADTKEWAKMVKALLSDTKDAILQSEEGYEGVLGVLGYEYLAFTRFQHKRD
jgi:hypothetical protein